MSSEAQAALSGPHGQQAAAFISLQNQLSDTQTSLSSHLEKIHQLEGQLKGHESLRDELAILRNQMENSHREMELFLSTSRGRSGPRDDEDLDDDNRSVVTMMDNEDAEERVRRRRQDGDSEGEDITVVERSPLSDITDDDLTPSSRIDAVDTKDDLTSRIQSLSAEVAEAVQISRNLQAQHSEAMTAVRQLSQRVGLLEDGMATKVAEEVNRAEQRWESWRVKFEDGWKKERENWEAERERLRGVVREWEEASRRGHEEVEDRELNDRLSEDEYENDGADANSEHASFLAVSPARKSDASLPRSSKALPGASRKARRRRPSHRTTIAVRALRAVADEPGTTTPKADPADLEESTIEAGSSQHRVKDARRNGSRKQGQGRLDTSRFRSDVSLKTDKDSSESGRDSGDTLKEARKGVEHRRPSRRDRQQNSLQVSLSRSLTSLQTAANTPARCLHGSCSCWSLLL